MAGESYTVDAELRLRSGQADRQLQGFARRLSQLGHVGDGVSAGISGMVSGVRDFGLGAAAAVGVAVFAFERLTRSAVDYRNSMEQLEIQTAAVMGAVDRIGFTAARGRAHALFEQYRSDAIASVATTEQLVMINNAIMGSLRGAGQSMDVVRRMTLDTVTASSALGVDFAQASRDMQLMVNGSAGMHVRLFQMMHATGAIAENAQAFNRLTTTERITRLQAALGRFSDAAEAYGHSFSGATSTFQDIVENLTATFYGPAFDRLRRFLLDVNERLINNRTEIERVLTRAGNWFADHVQVAFDSMISGMDWVGTHWDEIVEKGESFVAHIRQMIPELIHAAKVWGAITLVGGVVGQGASAAGRLSSLLPAGGGAAAAITAAASVGGTEASLVSSAVAMESAADSIVDLTRGGLTGAPLAAGAIGPVEDMFAAAAARAAVSAPIGATAALAPAVVGPAVGGFEALMAAISPLAAVAVPLAAAIAIVSSLVVGISEHFSYFSGLLASMQPLISRVGEDFMNIAGDLWSAVEPLLELFGFSMANDAAGGFAVFLTNLHAFLLEVREGTIWLRELGNTFHAMFGPAISRAQERTRALVDELARVADVAPDAAAGVAGLADTLDDLRELYAGRTGGRADLEAMHIGGGMTAAFGRFYAEDAQGRPQVTMDFRGSHNTFHQEFREADPDRVLMDAIDTLRRAAASRVQSGLSGLGR